MVTNDITDQQLKQQIGSKAEPRSESREEDDNKYYVAEMALSDLQEKSRPSKVGAFRSAFQAERSTLLIRSVQKVSLLSHFFAGMIEAKPFLTCIMPLRFPPQFSELLP